MQIIALVVFEGGIEWWDGMNDFPILDVRCLFSYFGEKGRDDS